MSEYCRKIFGRSCIRRSVPERRKDIILKTRERERKAKTYHCQFPYHTIRKYFHERHSSIGHSSMKGNLVLFVYMNELRFLLSVRLEGSPDLVSLKGSLLLLMKKGWPLLKEG